MCAGLSRRLPAARAPLVTAFNPSAVSLRSSHDLARRVHGVDLAHTTVAARVEVRSAGVDQGEGDAVAQVARGEAGVAERRGAAVEVGGGAVRAVRSEE